MSTSTPKKKPSDEALALRREDRLNVFRAALTVTGLLLVLVLLTFLGGDREYSENENRYLAGPPTLSWSSLADGTFMSGVESYLSDQFFARDLFVQTRSKLDLFEGKRDLNGVYVGKDAFLFEKTSTWDNARMEKTLGAIHAVTSANASLKSYMVLAPNATELLPDKLPANAPVRDQAAQISRVYKALPGVTGIDALGALKRVKDPSTLYYRTDHHWTAAAAEPVVGAIAKAMGLDTSGVSYKTLPVTNDFRGTLASTSGFFRTTDTISVCVPEPDVQTVVTYVAEDRRTTSLFDASKLKEKSKYDVFFGGNFGEVRIDTNADSDRVLLVLKDSYANSVVPALTPYFRTIVMVDPRYYVDNLEDTISKEGVTDLLWFYNVNTFLNDTSIAGKLG